MNLSKMGFTKSTTLLMIRQKICYITKMENEEGCCMTLHQKRKRLDDDVYLVWGYKNYSPNFTKLKFKMSTYNDTDIHESTGQDWQLASCRFGDKL
jgi:hypothetical protein